MSETYWAVRRREIASRHAQAPTPEPPKKGKKRATQAKPEEPVAEPRVEESPEVQAEDFAGEVEEPVMEIE